MKLDYSFRKGVYVLSLLLFSLLQVNATSDFWTNYELGASLVPSTLDEAQYLDQVQSFTAHPYVMARPYSFAPVANSADGVQFQDLRGVECYAQPDQLNLCGAGDTIPILLFTKSVDPIYDVELTLNFAEGLEYGRFAYVHSGPADLDTINVDNDEAPIFRISELSQDSGGVVVYVGVRAACDLDLASLNPSITFGLDYEAGGQACSDDITPAAPYGGNVSVPEVVFASGPSPAAVSIAGIAADACFTIPISQVNLGAGALGALFTLSDYGFEAGNTVSSISVDGTAVPATDIMTDATTGAITANLDGANNTGYFGGDGLLGFSEQSTIEVCFQATECFVEFFPTMSVVFACDGATCGNTAPDTDDLQIVNDFDFNVDWVVDNVVVDAAPEICSAGGMQSNFIVSFDVSNPAGDETADLNNIVVLIDRCTSLAPDTIYYEVGGNTYGIPGEAFIPVTTTSSSAFGRSFVDFNAFSSLFTTDPDLPGIGIEDLDGDGTYDDLPGTESLRFTMELGAGFDLDNLACDTTSLGCNFTRVGLTGGRDCNRERPFFQGLIPGDNAFESNSEAGIDGDTTSYFVSGIPYTGGLDFGITGRTSSSGGSNVSVSRDVSFSYDLDNTDFTQCANISNRYLLVSWAGSNAGVAENLELSALTSAGSAPTATRLYNTDSPSVSWIIDDVDDALLDTYDFTLTIDTNICTPPVVADLSIYVIDECLDCAETEIIRSCHVVPATVDPDDHPNCICNTEYIVSARRVSRGYTDRTLDTQLTQDQLLDAAISELGGPQVDTLLIMPGDTVEITTDFVVLDEATWSSLEYFAFGTGQITPGFNSIRTSLTHVFDGHLMRIESFTLNRTDGSVLDLGDVSIPGSRTRATAGTGAGLNATSSILTGLEIDHPGINHSDYLFYQGDGGADDNSDGDDLFIRFFDEALPSQPKGGTAFLDAIGGAFQPLDTVRIVWRVPYIRVPEDLAGGFNTLRSVDLSRITAFTLLLDQLPSGGYGPNQAMVASTCNSAPYVHFYEPEPKVEAEIDFQVNGSNACDAMLVIDYTIDNPPPADWYTNEYRPILGIEDFEFEIPSSYFYESGNATVELLNGGPSLSLALESSNGLDSIVNGTSTYLLADPAQGTISFSDSEKDDGTDWPDYLPGDNGMQDITQVGADLPLLGVGMGLEDTLRITIPLQQYCASAPSSNLEISTNLSYPFLPDYNSIMWRGTNIPGRTWYTPSDPALGLPPGVVNYWPYDRGDDDNPHRFPINTTYTELNTPTALAAPSSMVTNMFVADMAGSETNTYTLTSPDAIAGGMLAIEVASSVDLQAISGDATVFNLVTTTDSSSIYSVEISALAAGGTFTIDLQTDLIYCDAAPVCITPILGCSSDALAAVAALADTDCGGQICYEYTAGLAEVVTTFDYPSQQNGCMEQTYNIQYRNTGTSDLAGFDPTIYIPEGLTTVNGMWMVQTFSPNTGPTAIADPSENTAGTGVYGQAFEWPAGYFAGITGTDVMEEGEIVIISFKAQPTCDFTSGLPIVAGLATEAACNLDYETEPEVGPAVNIVAVPDPTAPAFEFEVSETRISCSDGAAPITLTATNTGKAPASMTELCFVLPAGLMLTDADVEAIAPSGYSPTVSAPVPVGTGGATEVCLTGPTGGVSPGGFLCLNILPQVGMIDCGPADISFRLKRTTSIDCAGMTCDIQALASESTIPLEVVPGAAIGESSLRAVCSATPGNTDLEVSIEVENLGGAYADDIELELYFDIDGSGEVESYDPLLAVYTESVTIAANGSMTIMNTFSVPEDQACPVVVKAIVPGCECGEIFIPFDPVTPDFIADLGTNLVLCPGESETISGLCGTFEYTFDPAGGGTAEQIGSDLTISLNPGFGVDAPVTLTAINSIGRCGMQEFEILLTQLEDFEFGPYAFDACESGCMILDLGIPVALQEDLSVSITPATFITDPTSFEPEICDPTGDMSYEIEFSLNGQCMATATMEITSFAAPTIELTAATGCNGGFSLGDVVSVTPTDLDGTYTTTGDGTFTPGDRISDAPNYTPGPLDIAAGEVLITVRTDVPDGPCGGAVARETFTILLVECGTFPWGGN